MKELWAEELSGAEARGPELTVCGPDEAFSIEVGPFPFRKGEQSAGGFMFQFVGVPIAATAWRSAGFGEKRAFGCKPTWKVRGE